MDMPEKIYFPDEMKNLDYHSRLGVAQGADKRTIGASFRREQERYYRLINEGKTEYTECYYLLEEAYNVLMEQFPAEAYVPPAGIPEPEEPVAKREPATPLAIVVQVLIFVVCNLIVFGYRYVAAPGSSPLITGVICAVAGILAAVRFSKKGREDYAGRTVILTIVLCVNVAITYSKFQKQGLYLDNQNAFEVVITVNGEPIDTLYNFEWSRKYIRPGSYSIASYKIPGDSMLEEFDAVVSLDSRSMYNVLSSGEYIAGTESYAENPVYSYYSGVSAADFPSREIKERWFELNFDYILESAPYEVSSYTGPFSSGHETTERTYILRKSR